MPFNSAQPPTSCTSKWRRPIVREADSRTSANAPPASAGSVYPSSFSRDLRTAARERSSTFDSDSMPAADALVASTIRPRRPPPVLALPVK
jgi:hypothetical protein